MNRIYKAKEKGSTPRNNRWVCLQDFDNSMHITVQGEHLSICERFDPLPNKEKMMELVDKLEDELYPKLLDASVPTTTQTEE